MSLRPFLAAIAALLFLVPGSAAAELSRAEQAMVRTIDTEQERMDLGWKPVADRARFLAEAFADVA